jgi:hypothetical protein
MTSFRRTDTKVQLYFNCPEKVDRIGRMCKSTNYKDMTVIISTIGERDLIAWIGEMDMESHTLCFYRYTRCSRHYTRCF